MEDERAEKAGQRKAVLGAAGGSMPEPYQARLHSLGRGMLRLRLKGRGRTLRYVEVLRLWQEDAAFRSLFITTLAGVEFTAFRWETPSLTSSDAERPFECVILDSPGLATPPDAATFAEHFGSSGGDGVAVFPNLGGDCLLVAPEPLGPASVYTHLAAFLRGAPLAQRHALWRSVGHAMAERVGDRPIWLSTAGGGVDWLHVRLDTQPKYYGYRPYAEDNHRVGRGAAKSGL